MRVWPRSTGLVQSLVLARAPGAGGGVRAAVLLLAVLAVGVGVLAGCATRTPAPVSGWDETAPAPTGYYRIKSGDTLSEVAERLKLSFASLARWNGIKPPYKIVAGGLLRIVPPGADEGGEIASDGPMADRKSGGGQSPASQSVAKADVAAVKATPPSEPGTRIRSDVGVQATGSGLTWQWPLRGPVKRNFAPADRTRSGIRIGGRPGAQVVAAESGSVVYSGSGLKGYGNLIIVQHNKNYLSAYGFNRRLLVREGDHVKRGQAVAEVGQTGGDWLLHFEIRKNGTPVDPMGYLPKSR